ncbi:MAG: NADH-quinone oxidoreductase subunit D [Actinobacteria bacterium]|nr:MAG: NADH-quinone oxidoreductase subunit D [Actinomycetota bacterium]
MVTSLASSTQTISVNVGPQHPSTHGVMHLIVELSGEEVCSVRPVVGYLHRGIEKLAEGRTYAQCQVLVDRMDYVSGFCTELAYCRAVETLAGIEVPERAEYLRTLLAELQRLASHFVWFGSYGLDLGAWTPFIYCFIEREMLLDLFEELCGSRMMPNFLRFGGVREEVPGGWLERVRSFAADHMPRAIDTYEALLTRNEIFRSRTVGLSAIGQDLALSWGLTGPMLRATGCARDLRKDAPYAAYDRIEWEVHTGASGDCYDRYLVRVAEMRESCRMAVRLIDAMPEGEVRNKVPRNLKPPEGEVYVRTETPRGELGVLIVSDGTATPYRLHFRSPALVNISTLPRMAVGHKLADLIAIAGSIDLVMGEIDR